MRTKSVTLADIARELGVSSNAVSLALRGKEGVSEALRERIMAKAREMNYVAQSPAQGCILALIPYAGFLVEVFLLPYFGITQILCYDQVRQAEQAYRFDPYA